MADAHRVRQALLQRHSRSRSGDHVLARMNHERGGDNLAEMRSDIVTASTPATKLQVGGDPALERTPDTAATREAFARLAL